MGKHRRSVGPLDDWRAFTQRIYSEWDADPGYYALRYTDMPAEQRKRAAVAWCSFYNLGIAADASERQGAKFWGYLDGIYDTAKRATERRHFRGNAGRVALAQWRERWPKPEELADHVCEFTFARASYFDIRRRASSVAQYGDYFIWKWCDLSEVLGYGEVDMVGSEKHSPKLPQQGAALIQDIDFWAPETPHTKWAKWAARNDGTVLGIIRDTYAEIARYGLTHRVPPRTTEDRPFGLQEAETVCCVYKQMQSGSYTYGTRTAKAVLRLEAAEGRTAKKMRSTLLDLTPYTRDELLGALASLKE